MIRRFSHRLSGLVLDLLLWATATAVLLLVITK